MSKIWYPYFQHKTMPSPLEVSSAKGAYINLKNGQQLLDGISSWWSVIHGYQHPRLDKAMADQLEKMSHMMLCGLTHEPAQKLADLLIQITPDPLKHVFYSDSGSVGCEVALKTDRHPNRAPPLSSSENRLLSLYWSSRYHLDHLLCKSLLHPAHANQSRVSAYPNQQKMNSLGVHGNGCLVAGALIF